MCKIESINKSSHLNYSILRKNISAILTVIASLFLSISFTACNKTEPSYECTDPLGCVKIDSDAPVKIGVLQALSGKVAPLGQSQLRGFELALDNKKRNIFGHPVTLQIEDTGCTAEGGANAALKLIADPQTLAIFGTTCSGAAATSSKAMSDAGLTMISGNNSAPFLTSIAGKPAPNWQPGYFRTASNEENAGKAAAGYVYQLLGLRKAATIHDNDIYTMGLTDSFKKAFKELGGEIVLEAAINKGDIQMLPVLTAVANSQAELLFFPLFQPEGNHILLQARNLAAFKDILMISDGALIEKTFLDNVGDAAVGMCFVGPVHPTGPAADQLEVAYETKFKELPRVSYYLSGYDAANLLFQAIEQAGVEDKGGTLHIGRQALRDALYGTKTYKGVTGNLSCDQFGDCAEPAFHVLCLEDPSLGLRGLESNAVFTHRP